jgi:hypothetical protein
VKIQSGLKGGGRWKEGEGLIHSVFESPNEEAGSNVSGSKYVVLITYGVGGHQSESSATEYNLATVWMSLPSGCQVNPTQ